MKRLSFLILVIASLTLPFACSEPDNTGSGNGTEQGGNGNGGEDDGTDNGGTDEATKYKLGDHYKSGLAEGIVAYVDESGEHGLIISIDETVAQWSTEHKMLTVMGGEFSMEDGASNTKYIRQQENWEQIYPAFAWCHAKNALGLSSWYLPAIDEFRAIFPALDAINATLNDMGAEPIATGVNESYWTSVEIGVQSAYAFSFMEGDIASYDLDKLNMHRVRAMRSF